MNGFIMHTCYFIIYLFLIMAFFANWEKKHHLHWTFFWDDWMVRTSMIMKRLECCRSRAKLSGAISNPLRAIHCPPLMTILWDLWGCLTRSLSSCNLKAKYVIRQHLRSLWNLPTWCSHHCVWKVDLWLSLFCHCKNIRATIQRWRHLYLAPE